MRKSNRCTHVLRICRANTGAVNIVRCGATLDIQHGLRITGCNYYSGLFALSSEILSSNTDVFRVCHPNRSVIAIVDIERRLDVNMIATKPRVFDSSFSYGSHIGFLVSANFV
jgi:hypothetical protein